VLDLGLGVGLEAKLSSLVLQLEALYSLNNQRQHNFSQTVSSCRPTT